jgi:REP element-mobilizing transposase RayT
VLPEKSAVLVTLELSEKAPNLRKKKKFALVRRALSSFSVISKKLKRTSQSEKVVEKEVEKPGFRVIHFAVNEDHIHLICEADSTQWLSKGVQKISIALARLLNADGIRDKGGSLLRKGGPLSERDGWIGKVFADRYFTHHLKTSAEISDALSYVMNSARKKYGKIEGVKHKIGNKTVELDAYTSFAEEHASENPWKPHARGNMLLKAMHNLHA